MKLIYHKGTKKRLNITHELCKCAKGILPHSRKDALVPLGYIR